MYSVTDGTHCESYWEKKLEKMLKKSPQQWEDVKLGLMLEYEQYDTSSAQYVGRYSTLTVAAGGQYLLVKHEVKLPGSSAKASGVRAALFVDKTGNTITLLHVGHHSHYATQGFNSEKDCIKYLTRSNYPSFAALLGI